MVTREAYALFMNLYGFQGQVIPYFSGTFGSPRPTLDGLIIIEKPGDVITFEIFAFTLASTVAARQIGEVNAPSLESALENMGENWDPSLLVGSEYLEKSLLVARLNAGNVRDLVSTILGGYAALFDGSPLPEVTARYRNAHIRSLFP